MIVDASVVVDAVCDPHARGEAARAALLRQDPTAMMTAPGHFAVEILSALHAAARRPGHPFQEEEIPSAVAEAERYGIVIEATSWVDVRRARELCRGSLRFADAVYVAAAERKGVELLTADARIARSGAQLRCRVVTVT